jgi:hypothetical protein
LDAVEKVGNNSGMEIKMSAVLGQIKRKELFQEIFNAIRQWPELERKIFAQAHYHGQSVETISHSFKLDVEKVSTILKQCDRRLYISLRDFRESSCENLSLIPTETDCLAASGQELKATPAMASTANKILDTRPIAV